jgi:hypothetical protein
VETREFCPESVVVPSARTRSALIIEDRTDPSNPSPYAIRDLEIGAEGSRVTIEGKWADRIDVILWFLTCRNPWVVLTIDNDRYGHVVSADFSEKESR